MVDTWATVGSCAQIGKNVHLSGGVGIGGVLEPVQAAPVIVEDNCFIGSVKPGATVLVKSLQVGDGMIWAEIYTETVKSDYTTTTGTAWMRYDRLAAFTASATAVNANVRKGANTAAEALTVLNGTAVKIIGFEVGDGPENLWAKIEYKVNDVAVDAYVNISGLTLATANY